MIDGLINGNIDSFNGPSMVFMDNDWLMVNNGS